jgi:NAD(P)-dependent dehydrogenase (short-subunit alcohol dehydrogenase family)
MDSTHKVTPHSVLSGRVALVTGGTSGIGHATAVALADAGAAIVITGRRQDAGEKIVALMAESGTKAHFIPCDVRNPADVEQMVQGCLSHFGRLDIAVNNAGVLGSLNAIADVTIENYDDVFNTNIRGTLLCVKYQM